MYQIQPYKVINKGKGNKIQKIIDKKNKISINNKRKWMNSKTLIMVVISEIESWNYWI